MPSGNPEKRAQKPERRAENIRNYAHERAKGQDSHTAERMLRSAEKRAQKADRRAKNIREYHGVSSSSEGSGFEAIGGAVVLIIVILILIAWIF